MSNLDSILKSRDITLPTKVHLVKAMVFPVVMYGCESWLVKKAECRKIDAFEQWCWRRLLRVPWTARRSNQSILEEIISGCSLEGLMLKLKLQYSGHLMRRVDSLEKTLMLGGLGAGGEGDDRGWDGWMASPTQWTWVWVNSGSWWWTGRTGMLRFMGSQRVGHDWATELNWTELNWWPATLKKTNKNQYSGCWPSPFSVPTRGEKRRIQRELFIKQSLTVSLLWWVPCCSGQWGYSDTRWDKLPDLMEFLVWWGCRVSSPR